MSKPEILRKWLYQNVIQIKSERAVEDGDKMYTVICAERDIEESRELTEFETLAGFLRMTMNSEKNIIKKKLLVL